jgi:hypothetical protein
MNLYARHITVVVVFGLTAVASIAGIPPELTKKNFKASDETQAIVILHINWGRSWDCGGFENAQLQKLGFIQRMSEEGSKEEPYEINLKTPSRLFVKDSFVPYVLLVEPGQYALSEFDVKVARSRSDVGHFTASADELIENRESIGGGFAVNAGEISYLGHFGLDCSGQPIPWRYYIEGRDDFDRYVEGFRAEYPYTNYLPVKYRIFRTKQFGEEYDLE